MQKSQLIKNIVLFLLISFITLGFQNPINQGEKPIENFLNRPYFSKLFSKTEQKTIKKNYKLIAKAEKFEKKALGFYNEADKQNRIARVTQNAKTKEKALKTKLKLLKKSEKFINKSSSKYFSSYDNLYKIYKEKFTQTSPSGDSLKYQYAQILQDRATLYNDSALKIRSALTGLPGEKKVPNVVKAKNYYKNAIAWYETALAALKGDSAVKVPTVLPTQNDNNATKIDSSLIVKKEVIKRIPETKQKEKSNVITVNGTIYVSNFDQIINKLNLSAEEKQKIEMARILQLQADSLNDQVENLYVNIDKYRAQAESAQTIKQKELLKQKAAELEAQAFLKLTDATKKYLQVNNYKHQIYKKHLEELNFKSESQNSKINIYTTEANTLFSIAKTKEHLSARLPYISDKYVKLMEANELELFALEKQEKAFLFYYALPDNSETIIADNENKINKGEEQLEVTLEKPAAGTTNYPRTYNYSTLKQSQVNVYALTSEFKFRVQVGAFTQFPSVKLAKKYRIIGKKINYKNLKVYFAGDFKSFEAINYVLDEVRSLGYKDAFIICYINGKLCSPEQAQKAIKDNKKLMAKYQNISKYELTGLKNGKSYYSLYPSTHKKSNRPQQKPLVKNNENKTTVSGIAFYVQLGAFSTSKVPAKLKKFEPLFVVKKANGLYAYLKGPFKTHNLAKQKENMIKKSGYKSTYIVAYNNDIEMPLYKAIKLTQNTKAENKTNTTKSDEKIVYRIQVGAYKNKIPATLQNKLNEIAKTKPVEKFAQPNGTTIYTVGYYTNYQSASRAKNELKKYNLKGFVVAFNGDKKISLAEAKKKGK